MRIKEGLKVRDFAIMIKTQALEEDAELLKHLVKSGSVKIDVLKMAARVGRESEIALKMLKKEGFRSQ